MVQQLFGDIERLKAEVTRLRGRIDAISIGNIVIPTATQPGLPQANNSFAVIQNFINTSGGNLTDGQVVILDTSGARRINTTTSADDPLVIGAVRGDNGPYVDTQATPVLLLGTTSNLQVDGTVTAGDYLATSAVAGKAASVGATMTNESFAIAMTDDAGGLVNAVVFR